jgi:hypothetical protein
MWTSSSGRPDEICWSGIALYPLDSYPADDIPNAPSQDSFPASKLLSNKFISKTASSPRLLSGGIDHERETLRQLDAAAEAIGRLHRLSLAIRKAGVNRGFLLTANSRGLKDNALEFLHEKGEYPENFENFVLQVLDSRYSRLLESPVLRDQLVNLIALRRQRFLQAFFHQRGLREHSIAPDQVRPSPPMTPALIPDAQASAAMIQPETGIIYADQCTESFASTFDHKNYAPEPTCSVASSQLVVSPVISNNENIPPPPKLSDGIMESECPYCHWALPARQFKGKRWRIHIEQDLQPYMCLYEECFNPPILFDSVGEWILHTNEEHSSEWICLMHKDGAGQLPIFDRKQSLEEHLKAVHGRPSLSESQLKTLMRRRTQPGVATLFKSCPFCETYNHYDNIKETQEHIAAHLLDLSIMALPWRDDVDEAEELSDGTGHGSQGADWASSHEMERGSDPAPLIFDEEPAFLALETVAEGTNPVIEYVRFTSMSSVPLCTMS